MKETFTCQVRLIERVFNTLPPNQRLCPFQRYDPHEIDNHRFLVRMSRSLEPAERICCHVLKSLGWMRVAKCTSE